MMEGQGPHLMETTRVSLLLRIKNKGDQIAWTEFDHIYRPLLYRFATARGLDHSAAEDIVQQCLTAIHQHIEGFEYDPRKGRFKGWLRTMVNNRIRNMMRDRHERPAESQVFRAAASKECTPDELFDQIWMDEHLKHALRLVQQEVEEHTFRAFQMYVIEERTVEEICAALGVTANLVHKSKYRITKRLAEKMAMLTEADE